MSTARPRRRAGTRPPAGLVPDASERERIRRSFLAMALSHELKQPLNALNLNAELLSKRLSKLPTATVDAAGPLQALGRVVDRVTGTLESFYVRVQPDPVPAQPIDLRPILVAAGERAVAPGRDAGVAIQIEIADDLPGLPAHAHQLAVALDELLDNAIRASGKGKTVSLRGLHSEDEVRIEVADEGSGMTPEVARRAVEIGFSTRGGDGTGLTIAKFVAYHHAGGFHVETRPGEGTTASMVLPVGGE